MLARCPDSHAEIAAKVGVDKSLVTRWRSGARKPTDGQKAKLEELYGIPRESWLEPSGPLAPPPDSTTATDAPASANSPGTEDEDEDNNELLQRDIREGMRELRNDKLLSGVKRAEALKKLADAQISLDKSTGENALTMQRIVAHPEFQRVARLIVDAITPYPEALKRVVEILEANA